MFTRFGVLLELFLALQCAVIAAPLYTSNDGMVRANSRGYDVSLQRRKAAVLNEPFRRDGITGSIGLGDNADLLYTVPIKLGDTVMAVHLDTGSSDLWVISEACQSPLCKNSGLPHYPSSSLNASGLSVVMNYGDSKTGTYASGPIGNDIASVAGVAMLNQQFAAINATTNPTIQYGAAGIFGLGFPTGSLIQASVTSQNSHDSTTTDDLLAAISSNGPLLSRMAMSGQLAQPMFAISLQRNTIEVDGTGVFSIGRLPDGIDESSLTWVPVRLYTEAQGGIPPPAFAPNELYPFRWEIDIDGVFIDGKQVPQSTLASNGIKMTSVSALIDTGNSLIRGPSDVVQNILHSVSPVYTTSQSIPTLPCAIPHSLAFQIGGKMFPVDPANFISPYMMGSVETCVASELVATDPPSVGALFSWSLGDPFLKSNLVAFYYGNLTHPSVDPPRIGFLSTVSANANDDLVQAVESASVDGGTFESTIQYAPTLAAQEATAVTIVPTTNIPDPGSSTFITSAPPSASTGEPKNVSASSAGFMPRTDIWLVLTFPLMLLVYLH